MKTHQHKKSPLKNLRFLENSHFMKLLCTSLESDSGQYDLERLKTSYARFVGCVQRLVASEQCAPLDMLHALSCARNRLVRLRSCEERRPAALVALWEGAVSHLEFEMRMFNVCINNPIQCRRGGINRKLRLTRSLDLLRNSLIEESQR